MGILLHRDKEYIKAGEYLKRAENIGPVSEELLFALGSNYEALNKNDTALAYFEKVLAVSPNMISALIKAAVLNMQLKRNEHADKYLDRLVNYSPGDTRLLNSIAYLCADRENYSRAEIYYKRLLRLIPGNGAILYNLDSMSGYQHNKAKALELLSQALISMPALKKSAKMDRAFECIRTERKFCLITK